MDKDEQKQLLWVRIIISIMFVLITMVLMYSCTKIIYIHRSSDLEYNKALEIHKNAKK